MSKIVLFARISLFVVFFWFGFLKIIGTSPAESLVHELFNATLYNALPFETFLFLFGVFECLIGLIWLSPKFTTIAYYALIVHLILTVVPLVVLPDVTWNNVFTPTIIGQYIIKNLLLLSTAMLVKQIDTTKM